jgi:hypothetical protein
MASANSGLQITNLDFGSIKSSLKSFLKQQNTLQDYDFDSSALSILVDLLAYNTQYNAYYLNMVANEMFLDSAVQRNSVVSHAKLLSYVPKSAVAPKAVVNLTVNQVTTGSLTLPKFTTFLSESVDGVNYNFVNTDAITVNVSANTAFFDSLEISQGVAASYSFTYDSASNPQQIFEIPDANIDKSTLTVSVQVSSSNNFSETYVLASDYMKLSPTSKVYFLQEGMNGNYQVYFGDGILGQNLNNNNIVNVSYITTDGTSSVGANSFTIMQSVGGFSNTVVTPVLAAYNGAERETIESIKFSAPKAYAAQGRAVTKEDYVYLIQNNTNSIPIDSVSVWGGEENVPPVYGQLFCAVKPSGAFTLTPTQKQRLITEVIKPISVLTVTPVVVDPDYNYLLVDTKVLYDPRKTTLTSGQIKDSVISTINQFSQDTLNTFNSTFKMPELTTRIQSSNPSIVTNETSIRVQKKIYPSLNTSTTYYLNFGFKIKKNFFNAGVTSFPGVSIRDVNSASLVRTNVFFEEVPTTTGGVASINITNQGFAYTKTPTVTITGDGKGAEAYAVLAGGRVVSIVVTNPGAGYTQALVTITPATGDTSGGFAYAYANLEGELGTLRTYYYDGNNLKTILNSNAGTIDYDNGLITLENFAPLDVEDPLGQFTLSVVPDSTILSSDLNKIIALDDIDPRSINVTVISSTR